MTDDKLRAALDEWLRTRDAAKWNKHTFSPDFRAGYDAAVDEVRAALAASAPDTRPAAPVALDTHSVARALEEVSDAYVDSIRRDDLDEWHTADRFSWFKYAEHIIAALRSEEPTDDR